MGAALAQSTLALGHEVVIVSGPVTVDYPPAATVLPVTTTDEMLQVASEQFLQCDGMIGAAAPCDYKPQHIAEDKLSKTGHPISIQLIETPDIVATLGESKRDDQWVVGFALETDDHRFRAIVKLEKKHCDMIISNGPSAIDSADNQVEILAADGSLVAEVHGTKQVVADTILAEIHRQFIQERASS